MDSLLHAGRSITSSLVFQEVLDAVAREVVDALGAGYCVIWEYVEDEDVMVERAGFSLDPAYTVDGDVIALEERPREREILLSREPVVETLSDPWLDAQSRESMENWGEKTCLSLPLRFGDTPLGVLGVCETERERSFTPEELQLARGLANQASAAVHNARVYRDLTERHHELEERARRERLLNELGVELELEPRSAHRARLRLPADLRAARGHRRRDLGPARRAGRSSASPRGPTAGSSRSGSAAGIRSTTGRRRASPWTRGRRWPSSHSTIPGSAPRSGA